MEKTKRPVVVRNATKVKALLFLQMREKADKRRATASEIARATNCNVNSLYVLLNRWWRWGLVRCLDTKPYSYILANEGRRYLGKLDDWFFSGYYSKKLKRRVPGYRGKMGDLRREILTASKAVIWWRYSLGQPPEDSEDDARGSDGGTAYYFKAPFLKAVDFLKIENSEERKITWATSHLIVIRADNAIEALHLLSDWGLTVLSQRPPIGQAAVDAKAGVVWA